MVVSIMAASSVSVEEVVSFLRKNQVGELIEKRGFREWEHLAMELKTERRQSFAGKSETLELI